MVRLVGDSSSYRNMMTDAGNAVDKTSQAVQGHNRLLGNFGSGISNVTRSLVPLLFMATSLVGITSVLGAATFGIHLANEAEQAEVAFGSMLKSTEKAKQLLGDLQTFAAATPFEFPQLKVAAKSLLAAGFGAGELIPMLRNIGDATGAMGTGAEGVQRATYALMQMRNTGRILGGDMMQLVNAGIPAQKILANALGKTTEQVQKMADSGLLGKREMIKFFEAFKSGKGFEDFAGGMEKQSKTVGGLFSTLKDNVGIAMTRVGTKLVEALGLRDLILLASDNVAKYTDLVVNGVQMIVNFVTPAVKMLFDHWAWQMNVVMSLWKEFSVVAIYAFDLVQQAALAFYDFVTGAFELMSAYVTDVWNAMGLGGMLTFSNIRQFLLTVLIATEFAFKNMGQIAETLWVNLQYGSTRTFNQISHFFTSTAPALFRYFVTLWSETYTNAFDISKQFFVNSGKNVLEFAEYAAKVLSGNLTAKLNLTPLTDQMKVAFSGIGELPERAIGDLEKQLKGQADEMNAVLGQDFNAFHDRRMGDLMPGDMGKSVAEAAAAADRVAYDAGKDLGKGIGKGIKAASPFDAAIAGSKEAADHMATYMMGATRQSSVTMTPVQKQTNEVKKSNDHLLEIKAGITSLVGLTREMLQSEPVILSPSNIA